MYEAILSIDLGASYTKVSYRKAFAPHRTGTFEQQARILMIDNSPLIPSLAVQTCNPSQPWVFGQQAAKMNPNEDMCVFQNWKADLFRRQNDSDSAAAIIVAGKFFDWLRSKLEAARVNVRKCQTRVAMPAFETFDENAALVARCMDLNGWVEPSLILKTREPHANAIGLFSRGLNVVGQNGAGELLLNYGRMFGTPNIYVRASRGFVHGTHGNLVTLMVVDIGAFTTDIAVMTFDVTSPDHEMADGLSAIRQESYALGVINELDRPLLESLAQRHAISWSGVSFTDRELLKRAVYHAQSYFLLTRSRGNNVQLEIGGPDDAELVATHTERFGTAVWEKIAPFLEKERPEQVYLTGGGSLIPPVAAVVIRGLQRKGISVGIIEGGRTSDGGAEWRKWMETGEGLQRLATGLGGSSVILQASAEDVSQGQGYLRPAMPSAPPVGYRTCRCQGGNKDCCFCGGRGYTKG